MRRRVIQVVLVAEAVESVQAPAALLAACSPDSAVAQQHPVSWAAAGAVAPPPPAPAGPHRAACQVAAA
ncbi:hypothetical protein [Nocardia iowensis]|uniref:Secreted protein n=1 Tax=Nocardia iowensis TaxID=204891 RepID=A0ABX8RUH8_NOCIO|nr:hypothetical protein [Nocardia iowensis]QXN93294.1 hypothetical protein KV110_09465 [Nocardia iowensis]